MLMAGPGIGNLGTMKNSRLLFFDQKSRVHPVQESRGSPERDTEAGQHFSILVLYFTIHISVLVSPLPVITGAVMAARSLNSY